MDFLLILMHFPLFTTVTENNTAMGERVKYKINNENLTIQLQSWSIIQNRNSDVGKPQGQLKSQAKPTSKIKPQINKLIEKTITLINPSNTHVGYRELCMLMLRLRKACLGYERSASDRRMLVFYGHSWSYFQQNMSFRIVNSGIS